jgi:hypothetical protein
MLRIPASGSAAPVTQIVAVTIVTTSFAEFMPRNYCETTDCTIRLFSVLLLPAHIALGYGPQLLFPSSFFLPTFRGPCPDME